MIKTHLKIATLLLLSLLSACTTNWRKSIKSGAVLQQEFSETIRTEISNGLIIMPVIIKGEEYRFLFDTGAILSISGELQEKFNYKTVSTGHLVDSDNHREKVKYVRIDTLNIGNIPFVDQTAFVGNFQKNPVIACLDIDGIIGSNLMRFCNWKMDYQNKYIEISKGISIDSIYNEDSYILPFHTVKQFGPLINFKIGKASLTNVKVDYGSNGSLTLPKDIISVLKEKNVIDKTFAETGFSQSGISGKVIAIVRERAFADTLHAENFLLTNVEIKTGKSGLFGGDLLSQFVVTMDWDNMRFLLQPVSDATPDKRTFGFRPGYSEKGEFYIQSVVQGSSAFDKGIKPGQIITKIDSINLTNGYSLCDYIEQAEHSKDTVEITLLNDEKAANTYTLVKRLLE